MVVVGVLELVDGVCVGDIFGEAVPFGCGSVAQQVVPGEEGMGSGSLGGVFLRVSAGGSLGDD